MTWAGARVLNVPWGREHIEVPYPAHWPEPRIIEPDCSGALASYTEALERSLEVMLPSGRLADALAATDRVTLVVDDPSRWTPLAEAVPVILRRVREAGIPDDRVSIVFGVGRHHAVDPAGMRERIGEEIVSRFACHSPPVDDASAYHHLGVTTQGVPVRVFGPVAGADVRILVGSVLPHLQAGFGGGWKLVFPGTSHRSTLGALHRQGLDGDARHLLGCPPDCNPMRAAIREAAGFLRGRTISVSHVLGPPGTILAVSAGDVDLVQEQLSAEVSRRFEVTSAEPADVVIATSAPWPGDPMQSFKVLLNHRAACRKHGTLVGLFWTDPAEVGRSFPVQALRGIAAAGRAGAFAIQHGLRGAERVLTGLAHPSRFMVRWARELVIDRHVLIYTPQLRGMLGRRLGPVRLFDDLEELFASVGKTLREDPDLVRVFPWGGLSYARDAVGRPVKDGANERSRITA